MELSVRDWMIIVGILLIVVVLVDGFRRVRNERRGKIRMSLNKNFLNVSGGAEENSSELPNGGARVIDSRDEDDFSLAQVPFNDNEPRIGDENLDLDQTVPILMESVDTDSTEYSATGSDSEEYDSSEQVNPEHSNFGQEDSTSNMFESVDEDPDEVPERKAVDEKALAKENTDQKPEQENRDQVDQEVFVINVAAKAEPFKGPDLLHILLACDLRFGDMNIFHRHENANGTGAVQFSMANSVQPGVFDLDAIDEFTSPSVSFFMSVPGAEDPMQAFDYMVETAQCLVKNLDGEMRDESRSVMTLQTLEHCRQRIRDIERRQLTQSA